MHPLQHIRSLDSCLSFLSDLEKEKMTSEKSQCHNLLGSLSEAEAACWKGISPGLPAMLAEGFWVSQGSSSIRHQAGSRRAPSSLVSNPQSGHLWHLITYLAPSI